MKIQGDFGIIEKFAQKRMNKFYVRATDGAVPAVKFEFLN